MPHDDGLVERHEATFTRVWQHIGELGTRMTTAEGLLERLDSDIYNHGRDGMKTQIANFITESRTRQDEQLKREDSRHRANSRKINIVIAITGIAMLLLTGIGVLVSVEFSKRSDLDPARIFHSRNGERVLSYFHQPPQDADLPPMR